jgi:cytochrome c
VSRRSAAHAVLLLTAGAAAPMMLLAAGLPAGEVKRGEAAYQKCYACHALEPGKNDLTGPSLAGIVDRPIAAEKGFRYSPALVALARQQGRWTPDLLDSFVADPEAVAPGTEMTFTGMKNERERADLLAFLRGKGGAGR